MFSDPLLVVVAIAALVVLLILLLGVGSFGRGGEFNRKHANRIMRARVLAQFIAVILIVVFVLIRGRG